MSDPDPNEWKRPNQAEPAAVPPAPFPRAAVFGALGGVAAGVFLVVALSLWGGAVGRVIVAAVGFGVAGAVLPWTFASVASNDNSVGCILAWLSGICGVVGVVVGVFVGLGSDKLEWWAYAGCGVAAAVAGGLGGGTGAERLTKNG